jgi:hypothetical protein
MKRYRYRQIDTDRTTIVVDLEDNPTAASENLPRFQFRLLQEPAAAQIENLSITIIDTAELRHPYPE